MAYVEFLSTHPEQRISKFVEEQEGSFPYPVAPPVPPLPHFLPRLALCVECYAQFSPGYTFSSLCASCSGKYNNLSTLTTTGSTATLSLAPISRDLDSSADSLILPTSLTTATTAASPSLAPIFRETDSSADSLIMTNMLHVVNDVLREDVRTVGGSNGSSIPPVRCYKCGSGGACLPCHHCQDFLCSSCSSFHSHDHHQFGNYSPPLSLSPLSDEEDAGIAELCEIHPDGKLAYFCQSCVKLICFNCISEGHQHHLYNAVKAIYKRIQPSIDTVAKKASAEVSMLGASLQELTKMQKSVREKKEEAIAQVIQIFKLHREAIVKREKEIIAQIEAIADLRLDSLEKEVENNETKAKNLKNLSASMVSGNESGKKALLVLTHHQLIDKLNSGNTMGYDLGRNPTEDDSYLLKSNSVSAQNALKSLCMVTTLPYPPLCTAVGEGLFHPRISRLCTIIVCTKDRAGEPCIEGGEHIFVQIKATCNGGSMLPVDIRDNQDGSYSINFRPRVKGEHLMTIAVRGHHIQGSPFTLVVDGGREYGQFGMVTQVFGSEGSGNGQFCRPWGICCDQKGNIIVGDRSNHRVQVFDSTGVFKHKFGSEGVRPGQFNRPAGVAVTRDGHIVVADKDNHRIQVLKLDGTFLFMFGSKGGNDGQMIYPYDVAVNQIDGRIAVTDTGNHRLLIFNHDGVLLGKFGYKGYLCGHFDSPRGIAFNDDGHIIVSDFNVHHILVIHPDGTTARILGSQGSGNGQFTRPQGIAVDQMGNFIVADTRNNRIVVMHPSGHFIAKFGGPGSGPGQLDRPTSVCVLPDGRIALVDFGNSRVQVF